MYEIDGTIVAIASASRNIKAMVSDGSASTRIADPCRTTGARRPCRFKPQSDRETFCRSRQYDIREALSAALRPAYRDVLPSGQCSPRIVPAQPDGAGPPRSFDDAVRRRRWGRLFRSAVGTNLAARFDTDRTRGAGQLACWHWPTSRRPVCRSSSGRSDRTTSRPKRYRTADRGPHTAANVCRHAAPRQPPPRSRSVGSHAECWRRSRPGAAGAHDGGPCVAAPESVESAASRMGEILSVSNIIPSRTSSRPV